MVSPPCYGLLTRQKEPVPLKSISVTLSIREFVAGVSATLNYENEGKDPLEAFFVFPMDEDSAVHSFEALVDGKKIVAELQEKSEARTNYENAISQGHQAFLLEEDDQAGDIFSCNVGNLPPGSKAALTLKYVQELPLEADGALRYVLPAILNPRYQLSGELPDAIQSVQCSSPVNPIEYLADKTSAQISLADGHKFDRDVELLVYYSEVHTPSVAVEMGAPATEPGSLMGDPSAMVSFYPNIPEAQSPTACGEFVFLMDRSGSMHCPMNNQNPSQLRIQAAKETLIWLLKSLPLGCYFNIYGFGTFFEAFFPESVKYTQDTMEQALKRVKSMDADLGGTEILEPLKAIYSRTSIPGHPLQLFVFTDGEVNDTFSVIREVKSNGQRHRCFSFGIGEGASTSLIKGIARASGGAAEFITGNERMQAKLQPKSDANLTIHRLAAKSFIQTKDMGFEETPANDKKEVLKISMECGVISSHTAFIAINKDLNKPLQGPLTRSDVPSPMLFSTEDYDSVDMSCKSASMADASVSKLWKCGGGPGIFRRLVGSFRSKKRQPLKDEYDSSVEMSRQGSSIDMTDLETNHTGEMTLEPTCQPWQHNTGVAYIVTEKIHVSWVRTEMGGCGPGFELGRYAGCTPCQGSTADGLVKAAVGFLKSSVDPAIFAP
ncbi:PREDICTED: von Willebrand factor A domain-containing protein 5A-like [Myotis brandtii]|uniref:von Willebrand factor A domain-containing protein 5A-like n=1 Tax=Myotis brandtii TaxID=109478 RepID=UPI000703F581|nr:PREDICTED: von Willebrand factor A domain-containing protein 5A-like [Myotis brandtii]